MATKVRKFCSHCGSENVVKDAFASWDMEKQEWVLDNFFDDGFCNDCEASGNTVVEEEEIPA